VTDTELTQDGAAIEDAGVAHVVIERAKRFGDLFRAYEIFLDDELVGEIRHGETIGFDIVPGSYLIHTQIDWCRSQRIAIEVGDGETVRLRTRARSPLLFFYWITAGKYDNPELTLVDGRKPVFYDVGTAPPEERKLPGA